MSKVFVFDTTKQPLDPVHPGRARRLLSEGRAAVWRRFPFTIMLKSAIEHPRLSPLRVKLDPGSKTTGIALTNDATGEVIFAAELSHRGHKISEALQTRRAIRRSRRGRHTRYRQPRFDIKAVVPTGTKKGAYTGRVLVRARGSFDIVTKTGRVTDISYKYCRLVQRTEGYRYALGTPMPLSREGTAPSSPA
jgi:hypothetical protein